MTSRVLSSAPANVNSPTSHTHTRQPSAATRPSDRCLGRGLLYVRVPIRPSKPKGHVIDQRSILLIHCNSVPINLNHIYLI